MTPILTVLILATLASGERINNSKARPLIIGHRGASGMYPEHTALAYRKAAEQGADYIECDVEVTKDLKLVCSHEPWISQVVDMSKYPQFANKKTSYVIDDEDPNHDWNDKGNRQTGLFGISL